MSLTARLLVLPLLALGASCAAPRATPFEAAPVATWVHVLNRGYADVVVYLADGNTPFRMGTVGGMWRAGLRVPNQLAVGAVRLLVWALDSGRLCATDPVVPRAGGVLALQAQPLLVASELFVLSYGALER